MSIQELQVIFEVFDEVKTLYFSTQIIQFIYRDIIQGTVYRGISSFPLPITISLMSHIHLSYLLSQSRYWQRRWISYKERTKEVQCAYLGLLKKIVHNYKQITGMSADASMWIAPPWGCQLAELKCIGRDASFDAERWPRYQSTPERRGCKVSAICVQEKQVGDMWLLRNSFMCFLITCRPKYMQVSQQQRTVTYRNIYLL